MQNVALCEKQTCERKTEMAHRPQLNSSGFTWRVTQIKIDGPHLDSWTLRPAATSSSFPPPPIPPPPPSPPSPPLPSTGPNPSWFCWFIWPRVWKRLSSHFSTLLRWIHRGCGFVGAGDRCSGNIYPSPRLPVGGRCMRARGCNCAPARRAGIPRRNSHTAFSGCEQVGVRLTERQQREGKKESAF